MVLRLLTNRREDLVGVRTQTINRLHRLLVDLVPTGAGRNLTADRAAALLSQVTPTGGPMVTRFKLAEDLITDVRDLDRRIAAVPDHAVARVSGRFVLGDDLPCWQASCGRTAVRSTSSAPERYSRLADQEGRDDGSSPLRRDRRLV